MILYICGIPWEIQFFSEEEMLHEVDKVAYCLKSSHTIRVNPLLTGFPKTDAILHEILHAVYYMTHVDSVELNEENIVTFLATGLTTILKDERNERTLKNLGMV